MDPADEGYLASEAAMVGPLSGFAVAGMAGVAAPGTSLRGTGLSIFIAFTL